ncbi:hypothetical protein BN7_4697 [Wickerhamomyces ciferrii]|uniref:Enoyl reductase (ER) domain-containing protein n=1 Tax=Wickerhamomyces ciferrii (strain ATCC 14091 / BCRC 22168 / CBS 111 / JCM 3599 / NBRC 0793 / NRRL Y-1031 F-60-10) TaxID=1206466 RepID=K0KVE0_WICCF|nr:uncharacterized protein BN7_4697 [Wickerhamomyces ciferrii]CCH45118.1 hypothetical protein BN7_4697 [Wickerhamomyces ciferrii]
MSINYKQVTYTSGNPLELKNKTFNIKNLKSDEILVRVSHAALNPIDLLLYHSSSYFFYKRGYKGIGRDFSGTVEEVGSKITDYVKGDEISGLFEPIYTSQGTVTQYLIMKPSESSIGKIPKNLSLAESASFPLVLSTAYNTIRSFHKPKERSRVLVIGGATSVGNYVIQLLKNYSKAKSIVSINSGSTAKHVKNLGADIIVDYRTEDVAKSVKSIVENDFQGEKFDLIIDCVGSGDLFPIIDDVLKPKSTESGFVTIVGDQIADYNQSLFSFFRWGLIKKMIPFLRNYNYGFVSTSQDYYPLARELFEKGQLKTYIDSVYELDDYKEAFEKLSTHKAKGKILVKSS